MNRTFTLTEFRNQVFKSDGFDKDFLKQYINKCCIKFWEPWTPLQWAVWYDYLGIVKYLVENGADTTANNDRAFRMAALYDYIDVIKYLLSTYIYSKESIHVFIKNWSVNDAIKELMLDYRQFSYIKACRY